MFSILSSVTELFVDLRQKYNNGRQFNDRQISVANFQDEKKTLQQILKTLFW